MASRMVHAANPICETMKKYIIQFAHQHLDFRIPEIRSIVSLIGCEASLKECDLVSGSPFMEIKLKNDTDAMRIMKRSVLSKRVYELWAEGTSVKEVKDKIDSLPSEVTEEYTNNGKSFRIIVETFNKKISSAEKIKKIELLTESASVFQAKINLRTPDVSFHLLEFYENDSKPSEEPLKVFFGRWVADGQRDAIQQYHLQKRHFIANTSMDACLSMVMANLAQVKHDDFVMDPFVGSGSLLVSSAHYGAYVMGTDIDYLLLHARAKPSRACQKTRASDESVRQNLQQYGLESRYIDVMVADASRHRVWRKGCRFDAIITDPPYGIRESAAKIATVDESQVKEVEGAPHYPQKAQYNIGDIYKDLLNFAAKFLELGGRLVYWLPIFRPEYQESNIPQHPCLRLESNCEQPLNLSISRRLITMVKDKEFEEIHNSEGASIAVDQYEKESFRQKYFKAVVAAGSAEKQSS
ncbi:tRNA (guanine(10)-N2)-methyltransferase homolog [Aplysia californica]|uniref:tRNA (guanine(10)-N(2))-methyltransferase TRMT11 n=1 Tax=Aplysia californica TaxID=6500 RepID=A0ABM0JU23_APLCA|nr:tRNA (guanine(10)-N2)-methyltransferase homolog [Aplysia californica]